MSLLAPIHDWPVDHVGAAAILPDGTLDLAGDTDVVFPLASLTKLLAALGTLVATEDGSIDLDDPAGPEGSTIRHLLAHASGLAFDSDAVVAPPGTKRIYSNTGFELLATTVQEATDMPFAAYVGEAVLDPLEMGSSRVEGSPAAGAEGTVRDLARLAADLMRAEPRVLARVTRDHATTVAFPGLAGLLPGFGHQDPNDWGLGFEIRGHKSPHWTPEHASPLTFGHFGRSGSLMWIDPARHAALIVLGDREFGSWAPPLWRELGERVLGSI